MEAGISSTLASILHNHIQYKNFKQGQVVPQLSQEDHHKN